MERNFTTTTGVMNIGGRAISTSKLKQVPVINGKMTLPPVMPPQVLQQSNVRPMDPISEDDEIDDKLSVSTIIEEKPKKSVVREYFRERVRELEEDAAEL